MTEWITTGNAHPNPDFSGEMSERQQYLVDLHIAKDRLAPAIAKKCFNCLWARVDIINPIAAKVVKGEQTKEGAMFEASRAFNECDGPQVNEGWADAEPICPSHIKKHQQKGSCF